MWPLFHSLTHSSFHTSLLDQSDRLLLYIQVSPLAHVNFKWRTLSLTLICKRKARRERERASWSLPSFASLHIACDLCVHIHTHNVHSSLIQAVFASSLSLEFDFHWWVKWRNQEERAEREAHISERERERGKQKRGDEVKLAREERVSADDATWLLEKEKKGPEGCSLSSLSCPSFDSSWIQLTPKGIAQAVQDRMRQGN